MHDIFELQLFDIMKSTALENLLNSNFDKTITNLDHCSQEYAKLYKLGYLDNSDLFYIYALYALSYEQIGEIDKAISHYKNILALDIDDLSMDDLWVYFARGLAVSRIGNGSGNLDIEYIDVHKELEKGFKVFPENEKDFNDDMQYNTRINIIKKFSFLIFQALGTFTGLDFGAIKNSNGDIINFGIFIGGEVQATFGYKRTDFYGDEFTNKGYRDMIDAARAKLQK